MEKKGIAAVLVGTVLIGGGFLITNGKKDPDTGYYAQVAEDGTVLRVIVADREFIDSGAVGDPATWVMTSPPEDPENSPGRGKILDKRTGKFKPDPALQQAIRADTDI